MRLRFVPLALGNRKPPLFNVTMAAQGTIGAETITVASLPIKLWPGDILTFTSGAKATVADIALVAATTVKVVPLSAVIASGEIARTNGSCYVAVTEASPTATPKVEDATNTLSGTASESVTTASNYQLNCTVNLTAGSPGDKLLLDILYDEKYLRREIYATLTTPEGQVYEGACIPTTGTQSGQVQMKRTLQVTLQWQGCSFGFTHGSDAAVIVWPDAIEPPTPPPSDTTPPVVTLLNTPLASATVGNLYSFTLRITDAVGVNESTITASAFEIRRPDNATVAKTITDITGGATQKDVVIQTTPGVSGAFTISSLAGLIADTAGNTAAATALGGFTAVSTTISTIIAAINADRNTLSQPPLTTAAENLISAKVAFLSGETSSWSAANNLTPVNVFDNIAVSFSLFSGVNVGAGSSAVVEKGISSGTVQIAPTSGKVSFGANHQWDTFTSGVLAQNDFITVPLAGLSLTHGSTDPGITIIATGFNATNDLWAATGQASTGQGTRVMALQDNPTTLLGYNSPNGLSILGWRGTGVRGTQGLIWDHNIGGTDELTQFSAAFWQGATALGMKDGGSWSQNLRLRVAGDAYTQQSTPINPHELRIGKVISTYQASNPTFQALPTYVSSAIILRGYPTQAETSNLLRGIQRFDIDAHTLGLPTNQFRIVSTTTDANGIINHVIVSRRAGFIRVRIRTPAAPAAGKPHRYVYMLEASTVEGQVAFSAGIEHCTVTESYHNDYNMTFVAVDFPDECWYTNHPTHTDQQWDSFYETELIPWVEANWGTPGDKRVLIGFSKSGFGAITKLFRNQATYSAAAAFDSPLYGQTLGDSRYFGAGSFIFGTQANLDSYYPPTLATNNAASFTATNRIWISRGTGTTPPLNFPTDVQNFSTHLTNLGIQHTFSVAGTTHNWNGGWTDAAMVFLDTASI
jgi:hypothetical protein